VQVVVNLERAANMDILTTLDYVQALEVVATGNAKQTMGAELKKARKSKGWSQRTLAAHLGVSAPFVGAMETGRKRLNNRALQFIQKSQEDK